MHGNKVNTHAFNPPHPAEKVPPPKVNIQISTGMYMLPI